MTNKKSLLTLGLSIAAGLVISSCGETKTETSGAQIVSPNGAKIGYIHTDSLLQNYKMVKDLEDQLIQERLELEGQFQAEYQKLEKDYQDAQKGAAQLSPEALQILQRRLQEKEQQLAMTQRQMENQLMTSESEKNDLYFSKIRTFVDSFGIANGFQIIYNYNGVGNVLFIDSTYDITSIVVDELNKEYEAELAKEAAE